ncbi:MAG: hypothetical protein U0800_12970 [Isosphaeraceae bacterium]
MNRKRRAFRPIVGDAGLEARVALSTASPALVSIRAAKNLTFTQAGTFVPISYNWDLAAKTVTFQSTKAGVLKGVSDRFNVSGVFNNVSYGKAGRITGTITLTSTSDPNSQLVFSVKGPSPAISPKGAIATQEKLTLTSATGKFDNLSNRNGSAGSIVMPPRALPAKPPATGMIAGRASLTSVTINVRRA